MPSEPKKPRPCEVPKRRAGECELLPEWLRFPRGAVVRTVEDLSEEQAG